MLFFYQYPPQMATIFGGEEVAVRLDHFRRCVCKHNILVVSRFYSRLKMPCLAILLAMSPAETEEQLLELVVRGALAAQIGRPAGLVRSEAWRG